MSDCSSKAFEVPKTCGNCGHSLIGDCVADEYRNAHLNASTDCGDWFSLEQRYQQLEQVARDMQKCIAKHAYDWTQVAEETADHYRDQLEALGVNLDD